MKARRPPVPTILDTRSTVIANEDENIICSFIKMIKGESMLKGATSNRKLMEILEKKPHLLPQLRDKLGLESDRYALKLLLKYWIGMGKEIRGYGKKKKTKLPKGVYTNKVDKGYSIRLWVSADKYRTITKTKWTLQDAMKYKDMIQSRIDAGEDFFTKNSRFDWTKLD